MSTGRDEHEDLTQSPSAREATYAFLAGAFCEPPSADLCADAASASASASADGGGCLPPALAERIRSNAASTSASPSGDGADARREFMNLFKVPGPQYVTPYESVFRDTRDVAGRKVKGLLMGPSAVAVRKWYRLAALDISPDYKDLPDHIAIEFGYLAHLCSKERAFAEAGNSAKLLRARQMQRDFLAAHVVSWIHHLESRIHENTRHAYFMALATFAAETADQNLAELERALGPSARTAEPAYDGEAS